MTKDQLKKKIAQLESMNDQLETEFYYLDDLLKSIGFPRGLTSAKEVAIEILEQSNVKEESKAENEIENL
jgi:hypothetical protein